MALRRSSSVTRRCCGFRAPRRANSTRSARTSAPRSNAVANSISGTAHGRRVVIVVDDGIATGTTTRAALQAIRKQKPKELVLAVPVAPRETVAELRGEVDDLICLETPYPFLAIWYFYRDFEQVSDEEVIAILRRFPIKGTTAIG